MYPVMLNIENRKCVVIGGGTVAARKAKKLAECGGDVTVISERFTDGFGGIDTLEMRYESSCLDGAFLVIAATDDRELNRRIAQDAKSAGSLAYAADDASCSDFILPASKTEGDITVAASTNGKYPFLAKRLRDEISKDIEFYNSLLPLLDGYRKTVIAENRENKRELLKRLVSDEMIELARKEPSEYEKLTRMT